MEIFKKNRIILHVDLDAFFAQVEERENPRFRGKPVVVGANPKEGKGRGVVSACNYEARKYGIKSGMPISRAWRKRPDAIFLPVNMELYQEVSKKVMTIAETFSTIVEKVSIDEAYLDLSYTGNYKEAEKIAIKIKKEIFKKEGLTSTIGIGPNKLIAKIACGQVKPNGLLTIKPSQVRNFLEPLDIEKLPGIGPKTAERFRERKINKIKDLRKLSQSELRGLFGKTGEIIYERARGIDNNPVISEEDIKSIGKEHTFEKDTRDSEVIFKTFNKIIRNVHKEFLKNNFSFRTITVVCRFSGFETHTKSKTLEKPSNDLTILKKEAKKLLLKFFIENPKLIKLVGLRCRVD